MDRRKTVDIDWGHDHRNKGDGRYFERGEVHVHVYDEKGTRSRDGRKPTEMERLLFEQVTGKWIKK